MKDRSIKVCPSTLAEGNATYSKQALRNLFDGQKVSHLLDFVWEDDEDAKLLADNSRNLSISGAQEKLSAVVKDGALCLVDEGEQGTHILKPSPREHFQYRKQIPANEHLTMQIASQVYGVSTAANGLALSKDGQFVYVTRRFDVLPDGTKIRQEDFCSLVGRTEEIDGKDFKYEGSYEDIAICIRKYIPAWPVAMEQFFRLVVFNYIYGNGDAHLKNFSVLNNGKELVLAPAYDLINTHIHVDGADFALNEGLSPRLVTSESYDRTLHPCRADFFAFAQLIGINERRANRILDSFMEVPAIVDGLIARSFLFDDKTKRLYRRIVMERTMWFIRKDK
ncbi:MAG: HipA domain-containing protein [Bacteroidales bacterium]|nr:HipA domain-containing protein [Bacteroidales bacterium]